MAPAPRPRARPRARPWAHVLAAAAVLAAPAAAPAPAEAPAPAPAALAAAEADVARARAALRRAEAALAAARAAEGAAAAPRSAAAAASTCRARLWTADPAAAAAYLERQHRLRAPYYVRSAWRSYEAGRRQLRGEDKSNSDPFIKWNEGIQQIVGALDLAPGDAGVWLEAGKATLALASLNEEDEQLHHILGFFSRACRLDASLLPGLATWLTAAAEKDTPKALRKLRKAVWRSVKVWNQTGVAKEVELKSVPSLEDGTCGAAGDGGRGPAPEDDEVVRALSGFQLRSLFATRVVSKNVLGDLPEGFARRLSELCIKKYAQFGKQFGNLDPNDLNDKFFSHQITAEEQLARPEHQARWPEMYRDSADFKLLVKLMRGALKTFVSESGLGTLPSDSTDYSVVLWAAVYPGNGGRHGYHVHQQSISSCVLYLQTAGASTPIAFVDPRGAPPVSDYEQYEKERDFEPVAPFHHNEYFFPEAGDLVCFPSWLVHNVPSHWESETRVAIAANLATQGAWDSWHRTAAGWS